MLSLPLIEMARDSSKSRYPDQILLPVRCVLLVRRTGGHARGLRVRLLPVHETRRWRRLRQREGNCCEIPDQLTPVRGILGPLGAVASIPMDLERKIRVEDRKLYRTLPLIGVLSE